MKTDLISRKALLEEMKKYCGDQRYLIPENVWEMVEKQPIAYDVCAVVDKLKTTKDTAFEKTSFNLFDKIIMYPVIKCVKEVVEMCFDEAIRIVRKGGVE